MRKFSITKIDLEKLDIKITGYRYKTGEDDPYIFASKETIDTITDNVDLKETKDVSGICGTYRGYKVFQNDDLAFGEIEIR